MYLPLQDYVIVIKEAPFVIYCFIVPTSLATARSIVVGTLAVVQSSDRHLNVIGYAVILLSRVHF